LIDTENPDQSKLLEFIKREPKNATPVSDQARRKEFEAFRAWIRAAVKDPKLAAAKTDTDQLGPDISLEVIRHTRQDRVVQSFKENIWVEMGRCVGCHSPELNRKKIGHNGFTKEDVDAISWVVPRNPAATLKKLVETGNIDTDDPELSLVLTKPAGLEEHGGGPKFAVGSRTDKSFRKFLKDYAAVINGKYTSADQIPKTGDIVALPTQNHLRIVDLPAQFDKKLLKMELYRRTDSGWSDKPYAVAENQIVGKRHMWQSMVFILKNRDAAKANVVTTDRPHTGPNRIIPGNYLMKVYIDREDKTKRDRDYELGKKEFYGQVQIQGAWKPGRPPKVVHAPVRD
jgi:hypothetical protein